MKSNVKYDPDHVEQAQDEGKVLVTFDVWGKFTKTGRITSQGCMTPAEADVFLRACMDLFLERAKENTGDNPDQPIEVT